MLKPVLLDFLSFQKCNTYITWEMSSDEDSNKLHAIPEELTKSQEGSARNPT